MHDYGMPSRNIRYMTLSGVIVHPINKPEIREGQLKIACIRAETGGFHGWLRLSELTRLRPKIPPKP